MKAALRASIVVGVLSLWHTVMTQNCNSAVPVTVGPSNLFASTGWPSNYPNDRDCLYNLTVSPGFTLKLSFLNFTFENPNQNGRCLTSDYVEVFDAQSNVGASDKICGSSIPPPVYSKTNWMKVKFHSNNGNQYGGFKGTITQITENDICPPKAVLNSNSSGTIQTPFYPRNYPAEDLQCSWKIVAPHGKNVKLTFKAFNVFKCGSPGVCACDATEVHHAISKSVTNPDSRLCQDELSPSGGVNLGKPFYSISNEILVSFKSGDTGSQQHEGFSADYEVIDYAPPVCPPPSTPVNYTAATGTIRSPNYPGNYPESTHCTSLITVEAGFRVKLNFATLDIEGGNECQAFEKNKNCTCDYVRVYNGELMHAALLGEFCGNSTPPEVISSGNKMLVEFRSGSSIEMKGFLALFTTTSDPPTPTVSPSVVPPGINPTSTSGAVAGTVYGVLLTVLLSLYAAAYHRV